MSNPDNFRPNRTNWITMNEPPPSRPSSSSVLNSRVFITAILSLIFVATLVLSFHLYLRYIHRRDSRRRRRHRRTINLLRLNTMVNPSGAGGSVDPPKSGLDQAAIASLPSFPYQIKQDENGQEWSTNSTADCAVCLSLLEQGEVVRMLPACNHLFHAECIDMWLGSHPTCPVCRAEVEPLPPPPPASAGSASAELVVAVDDVAAREMSGGGEMKEAEAGGSVSVRLGSSLRRMMSGSRERSTRDLERNHDANP